MSHGSEKHPATSGPRVAPTQFSQLSDAEIERAVQRRLLDSDRVAFSDLEIEAQSSRVVLQGSVASEPLRERALEIVADEMGLAAEDRIRIVGPGAGTGPDEPVPGLSRDAMAETRETGKGRTQNPFEAEQEGLPYEPPVDPPPDGDDRH